MPLHTYIYACGHRRHVQGRECSCFYDQVLRINNRIPSTNLKVRYYLPFDMGSCRHDRVHHKRYDCTDCVCRKSREECKPRSRRETWVHEWTVRETSNRGDRDGQWSFRDYGGWL